MTPAYLVLVVIVSLATNVALASLFLYNDYKKWEARNGLSQEVTPDGLRPPKRR